MAKVRYRCPEGGINSPGDASQDAMHTPSESKSNAERNSKTCDSELQWFEFKKQQGESSAPVGAVQKELAAAQPAGTSRAFGNSQIGALRPLYWAMRMLSLLVRLYLRGLAVAATLLPWPAAVVPRLLWRASTLAGTSAANLLLIASTKRAQAATAAGIELTNSTLQVARTAEARQLVHDAVGAVVKLLEALSTPESKAAVRALISLVPQIGKVVATPEGVRCAETFVRVIHRALDMGSSREATTMLAELTHSLGEFESKAAMLRNSKESRDARDSAGEGTYFSPQASGVGISAAPRTSSLWEGVAPTEGQMSPLIDGTVPGLRRGSSCDGTQQSANASLFDTVSRSEIAARSTLERLINQAPPSVLLCVLVLVALAATSWAALAAYGLYSLVATR